MRRPLNSLAWFALALSLTSTAYAQTPVKVLDNGADSQRLVFVVLGDGYAAADQTKFAGDVDALVVSGALNHDYYATNRRAFNVYRIDLVSTDSGVSTPTSAKNTALQTTYAGQQGSCWITEGSNTEALVAAAAQGVTKIDYFLVLVNTNSMDYGGCSHGSFMYVTSGSKWSPYVIAHEYGHGIAHLFDEYSIARFGRFIGTRNELNCSSIANATGIHWAGKLSPATSVPTTFNATAMNDNTTVGAFEGCDRYEAGVYRPVESCRMRTVDHLFCPVCVSEMQEVVGPHLAPQAEPRRIPFRRGPPPVPSRGPRRGAAAEPFEVTPARYVGRAGGAALAQNPQTNAGPPYVSLLLQVFSNGRIQVLRAVEGRGDVVLSNASADALYEVTQNNQTFATGPLPQGLGYVRKYSPPGGRTVDSEVPAASSSVSITVPNATINGLLLGNMGITLYRLNRGVPVRPITMTSLASLKANNQLSTITTLSPQNLATLVRQRLANRGRTP